MRANTDPVDGTVSSADADEDNLRSQVVEYDQSPDRRTVFPADADEDDLLTHWFTADDESFVDLRDLR
ncbi:MAG: hypothetical protein J07HB67_00801 [halophilic archaeon J07HB67]|jgi:hypothetical protein|nr:MAG: hypothetical protein J07HB67_00801 [halophilic archaeon J07HB67]